MKILRLTLAVMLAVTMMTFAASTSFAGGVGVDQKAELTLLSKGAEMGTAELELKIDEDGMLDLARIKVDAEGLVGGGTYTLFLGKHSLSTLMADDNGTESWDVTLDMFHKTTLVGLTVKIVYGTTLMDPIVLWGTVMDGDLID